MKVAPELLADNVANDGHYIGPVVSNALRYLLAAFPVTIRGAARVIASKDGKHPDGNPLKPLHWLANRLAEPGIP